MLHLILVVVWLKQRDVQDSGPINDVTGNISSTFICVAKLPKPYYWQGSSSLPVLILLETKHNYHFEVYGSRPHMHIKFKTFYFVFLLFKGFQTEVSNACLW